MQDFIFDLLKRTDEDVYKATAIRDTIRKEISKNTEEKVFLKYVDKVIAKDGLEYKLHKVDARFWDNDQIRLHLHYITCSKLDKSKQKIVDEAIARINEGNYAGERNFKIPLWFTNNYIVELKKIVDDKINLIID